MKAPISGVAGLRQVDVGNIVNASTQTGIVTIAQIEPIAVIFTAPEEQLPDIKAALAVAPPKVIALSTDGKRVLSTGTLAVINNQVDTTSGTIRLKAVFDNKDHALWPGQSVSTRLLVKTLKDATVVPDDAVQHGTDGLYAYAVNQDNKAELRKIKVTKSIDGRSVVDEGLSPGQQVITAGQYKVQPGTLVSTAVASSDAGPAEGQPGMSDGISAPFIRYPIGTSLMMAGILFVGLVAYPLLPVAPLPQVDFPTIQVTASLPGRQPGDHGLVGGAAAGAAVRADSRHRADDLDELSRHRGGHDPVRPQPHHRWRRQRRAGRDQRRQRPVAEEPSLAADLSQGQSGGLADPAAVGDLGHAAADHRQRRRRRPARAADQPDLRRRPGHHRRPAEAVDPRPDRSGQAGRQGPVAGGRARQIAITTVDSPKGNIDGDTRAYTIYANDQLLDSKDWNDVIIAYRNGGPLRIRDIGQAVTGPEDAKQAAWANGKRGVFLVVFKQPGANVIETVDKIKATLPRLVAAIPPAIKIEIISDRTQTIRAAVEDVQFTLLLTIALVVMVIFVFLRSFWATVIPTVTVPLALLGACALMWVFGYTLDNLSLMALTIAVGFVVDDAIVMLENITRYIEEGEKPMAAAFKGASEIGFTIVSISISLVAVLIPLLLMGGIIGRLFREFAVTLAMTIFVSMVVSLTLTPMMASRFLRAHSETRHGRFYQWSERAFDAMLHAYERGLDLALRWKLTTLMIFFATLGLSVYLFVIIPKGFFPQQDIGLITATSEASQDISFADMKRHQEALGKIVMADPDVATIAMTIGGSGRAGNNGNMFITLKPRNERNATAQQIIARLRPKLEKVEGARLFMQAAQDVRLGGRPTRTQFEFTLQDANLAELNEWAPKILAKMQTLPELRDVATDQQTKGTTLELKINRDTASRYGIQPQLIDDTLYDAFGQRQVTQYFTQLNSYHVILEMLPELQGNLDTLNKIYVKSPTTATRCRCRPLRPGPACRCGRSRSATRASSRRSRSASTSRRAWRSARPPTPCRRRWSNSARRRRSIRASRAPRRRSSNRSAPCRC